LLQKAQPCGTCGSGFSRELVGAARKSIAAKAPPTEARCCAGLWEGFSRGQAGLPESEVQLHQQAGGVLIRANEGGERSAIFNPVFVLPVVVLDTHVQLLGLKV